MDGSSLLGLADGAARGVESAGIAILVAGHDALGADVGRAILLGLELLVAADIIATVTAPQTPQTGGQLAVIVLIRTFLSLSPETEIEGRWPWRRADRSAAGRGPYLGSSAGA